MARSHKPSVQRHKQCYDVCRCMPTFLFFLFFQSETAITKCKKVCLYGKNTSKILGSFIDTLDLFACPRTPLYAVLGNPKPCVEKLRNKSDLVFLVKKTKNCQFLAKNHWKSAKITKNRTSCKPTTPLRSQRDLLLQARRIACSLRASRFHIVSLFWL